MGLVESVDYEVDGEVAAVVGVGEVLTVVVDMVGVAGLDGGVAGLQVSVEEEGVCVEGGDRGRREGCEGEGCGAGPEGDSFCGVVEGGRGGEAEGHYGGREDCCNILRSLGGGGGG